MGQRNLSEGGGEAPRVFVTYSHDSPEHKELVRRFATFLREDAGLDVHLDTWYDNQRRDWSGWAIDQLTRADFILVIASPDYKKRADGFAPPEEGRGAQFEAAILRNELTRNLIEQTRRILPVVLPGRSIDEIPVFLTGYSATHYVIDEFTVDSITDLLVAITGEGEHPMPARGTWVGSPYAGKTAAPAISGPVRRKARLLTSVLQPSQIGADLTFGGADLDAEHYGNSIVHRCNVFCGDPRSAVEYTLGRRYHEFETVVGILDSATDANQIGYFQVFLDNEPQQQVRVGYGAPVRINYNVERVLRLRMVAYRPDTVQNPMLAGAVAVMGRSTRLPELAWGDPTLFE
ncbi:SEFIR domain-containing protein [Nocardia sp. BMG111209]|uniref:SEFIR domain-containing protein n=1 Tax=Nocardia sp. BMG111209 TaxID=1160137 RepID=UPI00039C6B12|nr:SEFIR domain-containing protein [Nocardia sp. BMG111209]